VRVRVQVRVRVRVQVRVRVRVRVDRNEEGAGVNEQHDPTHRMFTTPHVAGRRRRKKTHAFQGEDMNGEQRFPNKNEGVMGGR
jgi:hypothetical protein